MAEDGELIEALATDLAGAFAGFVRAYADLVYTIAYRCSGSRSDADDLSQEVFVRAYKALRGYPDDRIRELHPKAWLSTIALNTWRNEVRRRARRFRESPLELAGDPASGAPGPAEEAIGGDAVPELAASLLRLPAHERIPVVLRHVAGLGYADIAEVLECPVGTAKARVHRGLVALRAALGGSHDDPHSRTEQLQEVLP